jgi:hypothetical protein
MSGTATSALRRRSYASRCSASLRAEEREPTDLKTSWPEHTKPPRSCWAWGSRSNERLKRDDCVFKKQRAGVCSDLKAERW